MKPHIIKIPFPKELIVIKNNEHYFDVSDTKKFKTYVYYINNKIGTLIKKYNLMPHKHFLHAGNRLLFSKNKTMDQTWFEPISGTPCYASWYTIRPLLPNIKAPAFFDYKDNIINLERSPNIISYINIVELTNNKLLIKSTDFQSFFDKNVNTKKLIKKKVLTRKNYLRKIGNCGFESFEINTTDAVIMSKKAIIKSKPKTKILIIIDNPYSIIDKIVDNEYIYRDFNLISNMFDINIFNSLYIIKYFTQKYNKYLHNLTIYKYPSNPNKNNLLEFCKSFLQNIIEKIINKPYLLDYNDKIEYKNTTVYRPNHGTVNILRQGLFSLKILQLFKKRNPKLFNQIFNSKERLICLILACFFKSLTRIGEGIFEGKIDKYINEKILKKMFPGLPIQFYKDATISGHGIFSSILYKSIFDNIGIKSSQYQDINYLIMYYLHLTEDGDNKIFKIKNFNFDNSQNKYIEPIVIRSLISVGHYLDHCRGSYSGILYEPFVRLLNNTILLTLEDKKYIMNFVKEILIKTQFKNKIIKNEVCTIEDETLLTETNNPSKKCCDRLNKHLSRNTRYTNKKFFKLSNNFSQLYKTLDIENQIKKLL